MFILYNSVHPQMKILYKCVHTVQNPLCLRNIWQEHFEQTFTVAKTSKNTVIVDCTLCIFYVYIFRFIWNVYNDNFWVMFKFMQEMLIEWHLFFLRFVWHASGARVVVWLQERAGTLSGIMKRVFVLTALGCLIKVRLVAYFIYAYYKLCW